MFDFWHDKIFALDKCLQYSYLKTISNQTRYDLWFIRNGVRVFVFIIDMEVERYQPEPDAPQKNDDSIYWLRVMSASLGIWPEYSLGTRKLWWKRLYYFMIIMHWYNTYLQVEFFCHNFGELKTVTEVCCLLSVFECVLIMILINLLQGSLFIR